MEGKTLTITCNSKLQHDCRIDESTRNALVTAGKKSNPSKQAGRHSLRHSDGRCRHDDGCRRDDGRDVTGISNHNQI